MIYLFLAEGFEEIEALATLDFIRRAGIEIETVGISSVAVMGAHNITVMADRFIDDIQPNENVTGIILPGGQPGTDNLENCQKVQQFIDYCNRHNILMAAICAAPSILGHKGLLKGKNAICYDGYEKDLSGAKISKNPVCRDGNVITAAGAGVSIDFAAEIVAAYIGTDKANSIKEKMKCIR